MQKWAATRIQFPFPLSLLHKCTRILLAPGWQVLPLYRTFANPTAGFWHWDARFSSLIRNRSSKLFYQQAASFPSHYHSFANCSTMLFPLGCQFPWFYPSFTRYNIVHSTTTNTVLPVFVSISVICKHSSKVGTGMPSFLPSQSAGDSSWCWDAKFCLLWLLLRHLISAMHIIPYFCLLMCFH